MKEGPSIGPRDDEGPSDGADVEGGHRHPAHCCRHQQCLEVGAPGGREASGGHGGQQGHAQCYRVQDGH